MNVVHSVDGYILRQLIRRCNYDPELASWAYYRAMEELMDRSAEQGSQPLPAPIDEQLAYYIDLWERTNMVDPVILPYLYDESFRCLPHAMLVGLRTVLESMLPHKPFPVITIHDDFRCHPNNMNPLREHYRNLLAELSESTVLDDILSQIYGVKGTFPKRSNSLGEQIRNSNYALC